MKETTSAFQIVWNGRDGWCVDGADRGALLPPYESRTTLGDAIKEMASCSSNPMIRARTPRQHGGGKRRKYSEATRQAVYASRGDGLTLQELADNFEIPLRTVHNIIVSERSKKEQR